MVGACEQFLAGSVELAALGAVAVLPCAVFGDVLGGHLEAASLSPGAQLGELVLAVLVLGADARPDRCLAHL